MIARSTIEIASWSRRWDCRTKYCLYRRRLLGEIARVAARPITAAIRTLTGERELAVGIVACLPTHGGRANWHPHRHHLVTDGGFRPDGTFIAWPVHDTARLTEAIRRAVLRRFVRLDLFDENQAARMRTGPHPGFHVHNAVWVPLTIAPLPPGSPGAVPGILSRWNSPPTTGPRRR